MTTRIVHLHPERLTDVLRALFTAHGSSDQEADDISQHLVEADLAGHPSHGSGLTPNYVAGVMRGSIKVNRRAERIATKGSFLLFNGDGGFGQSVGLQVTDTVADAVAKRGTAVFGLRNVHHLGRIGTYGERLAAASAISALFVNVASRPMVAPFRGRTARLGTNPVCITIPRPASAPVVLDFATSTIAIGKVRVAMESGKPVPAGTLIDSAGNPTTDPAVMYADPPGALTPMAGHKGAGLNIICELLAACIGGAIMKEDHEQGVILNNMVGMAFAAGTVSGAEAALEEAIAYFRASPTFDGEIAGLPGDVERESRVRHLKSGVPMPAATWEKIVELALSAGLARQKLDAASNNGANG